MVAARAAMVVVIADVFQEVLRGIDAIRQSQENAFSSCLHLMGATGLHGPQGGQYPLVYVHGIGIRSRSVTRSSVSILLGLKDGCSHVGVGLGAKEVVEGWVHFGGWAAMAAVVGDGSMQHARAAVEVWRG